MITTVSSPPSPPSRPRPATGTTRRAVLATRLGDLTLVLEEDRPGDAVVTGLYFPGHWTRPDRATKGEPVAAQDHPLARRAAQQLADYLDGRRRGFDLPLRLDGSPLHRAVWRLLEEIPYGATTTYGALAAQVGAPAQAVGQAVGANPVSVVVPCHRVLGADGSLTGYAGGLGRKRALLAIEEPDPATRGTLF